MVAGLKRVCDTGLGCWKVGLRSISMMVDALDKWLCVCELGYVFEVSRKGDVLRLCIHEGLGADAWWLCVQV